MSQLGVCDAHDHLFLRSPMLPGQELDDAPAALAEAGAFLAFDGPSRAHHGTDWRLLDSIAALVDTGHAHQVLLGGDTTTASARSGADGPGMPFLLSGLRPRIERELGVDVAAVVFVGNPARAFAANWVR